MKNKFIQIAEIRFRKKEIHTYYSNGKRLYVYQKHQESYFYFDFNTDEELKNEISKLDTIFMNSNKNDEPIKKSITDLFVDEYSDIRNDGKLLGNQDIVEKLNNSDKMNETVQKIKDIFNGKSDR